MSDGLDPEPAVAIKRTFVELLGERACQWPAEPVRRGNPESRLWVLEREARQCPLEQPAQHDLAAAGDVLPRRKQRRQFTDFGMEVRGSDLKRIEHSGA